MRIVEELVTGAIVGGDIGSTVVGFGADTVGVGISDGINTGVGLRAFVGVATGIDVSGVPVVICAVVGPAVVGVTGAAVRSTIISAGEGEGVVTITSTVHASTSVDRLSYS